jgi:DNA-binding MarR family transcriptional regulator
MQTPLPAINRYRRAAQLVSDLYPAMTVRALLAFLVVAEDPGHPMTDYQKVLGMPLSTTSRVLLDLSEGRRGGEGFGLLERRDNPMSYRERLYRLSPKGTALANRLALI